jgi:hypothetical protein
MPDEWIDPARGSAVSSSGRGLLAFSIRSPTASHPEAFKKHPRGSLTGAWMRKPFALFMAAALIAAGVWWWTVGDLAVSIVPGWHVPILAPYAVFAIFGFVVLLAIVFVILFRLFGRKSAR